MSDDVIQITDEGKKCFQVGREGKPFTVDVVAVQSQWNDVDRAFRNEAFEIPPDAWPEYNRAQWKFVCALADDSSLNMTQVLAFMKQLHLEGEKLKRFFEIDSPAEPSSRESTTLLFGT